MASAKGQSYPLVVKQKRRYRRRTKGGGLIAEWPAGAPQPSVLAHRVSYVGSAEHKSRPVHPSYGFQPALRSDASRCDPDIDPATAQIALVQAVQRVCVSQAFEGEFPRYVWGRIGGVPHVARLTNSDRGEYKGWPIEEHELPTDRQGLLSIDAWEGGHV